MQMPSHRTVRPVSELIRFVIGPEGEPVPDLKRKLPGRGIWVTATNGALGEAIKRKAFSRSFKREIRLPADLVARTERLLERAVIDALAIAGKAGLVAAGRGPIFDLGAIGFGIEPPKCDTCSPARRPCERDCFGALPAPGTVSDRRSAPEGRRGCAGLSRRGN